MWAVIVATYCPSRMVERLKSKSTGGFYQPEWSPCREEATKYGSATPIVDGGLADAEPPQQRAEVQSRLAGAAVGILRGVTGKELNRLFGLCSKVVI